MLVGKCGSVCGGAKCDFWHFWDSVGVCGCLAYYVKTVWVSCLIRNLIIEWL